ncbi:MAG: GFA family protein [Caulobacteraceae bacterium]
MATRYCWCRDCQYFGAGNATVNIVFPKAGVTVEGEVSVYESLADSGNRMRRSFCPRCGTSLFSAAEPRPHLVIVRAGALDDPNLAQPAMTIWASSAPRWACIDADLPQVPRGQPS